MIIILMLILSFIDFVDDVTFGCFVNVVKVGNLAGAIFSPKILKTQFKCVKKKIQVYNS